MRYREILRETFGFSQDNPALHSEDGKEWLARKQKAAIEDKKSSRELCGLSYYLLRGPCTATMGMRQPMYFSSKLLNTITGCRDEARKPGEGQFDRLLKRVQEEGFDFDPGNAVLVGVNHEGDAYVIEGNTRAAVAAHLGIPLIPCEFRWFNGGELAEDDLWSPKRVAELGESKPVDKHLTEGYYTESTSDDVTLYHGTDHAFADFAHRRKHRNFPHSGILELGYSFTTDIEYARQYGKNILQIRLNWSNPFRATIQRAYELETVSPRAARKWKQRLKAEGYDGVIFGEGSNVAEYIPFDPRDIEILGDAPVL
jgi:hypothetical protein